MHSFEIKNILSIQSDTQAGEKIVIDNDYAQAEIYLRGANLTHFQPKGTKKVIFDGKDSYIVPSKSTHFGIPVCWPWFGPHSTDSSKPQHGFARDMTWKISETKRLQTGETFIRLQLTENKETMTLYPYSFKVTIAFTIGKTLTMVLTTHNTSLQPIHITQALHNYFYVSDVKKIYIKGLENVAYLDQLDNNAVKYSSDPIHIHNALDRIYIDTSSKCTIVDPIFKRKIYIEKENSYTTVVWNPGAENTLHDIGKEKYSKFICIESANAKKDIITVAPDKSYTLSQKIYCENSND